jgi:hypothetical protein
MVSVPQLSVFVENKPGHLADTLGTLAAGGVNILRSLTDTTVQDPRLVVDQVERAKVARGEASYVVAEHQLCCFRTGQALWPSNRLVSNRVSTSNTCTGDPDSFSSRPNSSAGPSGRGNWSGPPTLLTDARSPVVTFDRFFNTSSAASPR